MPSHAAVIADLMTRVLTGDPWHADNIRTLLHGVTAADAQRRPVAGGHSIWELVLHMTGWAREAAARLDGAPAGDPAGGDWPRVEDASDAAWAAATRALFEVHAALAARLPALADATLDEPVRDPRNRATGTGLSKLVTLHGLVHHTVYHAGQIAQVKRALGTVTGV